MARCLCDRKATCKVTSGAITSRTLTTKRDKPASGRESRAMSLARFAALSNYDATPSGSDAGSRKRPADLARLREACVEKRRDHMNGYRKLLAQAVRLL